METQPQTTIPRSIAKQMTGIQWTDFTGNPWAGCTQVEPRPGGRSGCTICYAKTFSENRLGVTWGAGQPRHWFKSFNDRMRRLNRLAAETGHAFSVFSLSLGDYLDPEIAPAWRLSFIDTIYACGHLNWLLLTHRPHLAAKLLPGSWRTDPPANVWPGVTIDHPAHGQRWGQHLDMWGSTGRAWVSAEPLAASLRTLDLSAAAVTIYGGASNTNDPSWEFNPDWVREAVDRYGPDKVFFKQYGDFRDGVRVGKKAAGRDIAGQIYDNTT